MPNKESTDMRIGRVRGAVHRWREHAEKELNELRNEGLRRVEKICAHAEELLDEALEAELEGAKAERVRCALLVLQMLPDEEGQRVATAIRGHLPVSHVAHESVRSVSPLVAKLDAEIEKARANGDVDRVAELDASRRVARS